MARAAPDGYTLFLTTSANAANAAMFRLRFYVIHDLAPVASIGRVPFVMEVHPSVPANTVAEFIAHAKAHPGKINMASAGTGNPSQLCGELFKMMAGVNLFLVPYRGSQVFPALLAGEAQLARPPYKRIRRMLRAQGALISVEDAFAAARVDHAAQRTRRNHSSSLDNTGRRRCRSSECAAAWWPPH